MKLKDFKTIEERKAFIEKTTGVNFSALTVYPESLKEAARKNCENMIGAVQIPLGIAGPMKVKGEAVDTECYIPLATTEGALVASVNRGCKVITLAGGAVVKTVYAGMTRGSVFETEGIEKGFEVKKWIESHAEELNSVARTTSTHISFMGGVTKIIGKNLFIRFTFDTDKAMGMNMVTIATQKIATYLEEKLQIRCVAVAGNFDVDKKPSWMNFIHGRGRQVWAEVTLPQEIVRDVLKTTPEAIHDVAVRKCLIGSAISGSMGFNAHTANIVAAMFIACGQDPAHVSEGSMAVTTTECIHGALYASVHLPDLPMGIVGGGTSLPAQREALSILGVTEQSRAEYFAEITAAAILAGELSLLASLAAGSLAVSHQSLARGK